MAKLDKTWLNNALWKLRDFGITEDIIKNDEKIFSKITDQKELDQVSQQAIMRIDKALREGTLHTKIASPNYYLEDGIREVEDTLKYLNEEISIGKPDDEGVALSIFGSEREIQKIRETNPALAEKLGISKGKPKDIAEHFRNQIAEGQKAAGERARNAEQLGIEYAALREMGVKLSNKPEFQGKVWLDGEELELQEIHDAAAAANINDEYYGERIKQEMTRRQAESFREGLSQDDLQAIIDEGVSDTEERAGKLGVIKDEKFSPREHIKRAAEAQVEKERILYENTRHNLGAYEKLAKDETEKIRRLLDEDVDVQARRGLAVKKTFKDTGKEYTSYENFEQESASDAVIRKTAKDQERVIKHQEKMDQRQKENAQQAADIQTGRSAMQTAEAEVEEPGGVQKLFRHGKKSNSQNIPMDINEAELRSLIENNTEQGFFKTKGTMNQSVSRIKGEVSDSYNAIMRDSSLTSEERAKKLAELRVEAYNKAMAGANFSDVIFGNKVHTGAIGTAALVATYGVAFSGQKSNAELYGSPF